MDDSAIRSGDLRTLFIEQLGWDHVGGSQSVELDGRLIEIERVAHKRGVQALVHRTARPLVQTERYVRSVQACLAKLAHEHILIVMDPTACVQTWAWALRDRQTGRLRPRLHPIFADHIPEEFLERIEELAVSLEEEETVSLLDVTQRMAAAFDGAADQAIFFRRPGFAQESDRLARRMQRGGPREFDAFVIFHHQLAIWFIRRYRRLTRELEDLAQAAVLGLIRAARTFDLDQGTAFSTYAFRVMQTECWRYLPLTSRLGAMSDYSYQRAVDLLMGTRAKQQTGDERRWATLLLETAEELGLTPDRAEAMRRFLRPRSLHPASLARQARLAGAVDYSDDASARYREPLADLQLADRHRYVVAALSVLPPKDEEIIRRRFGIDRPAETLEQIGGSMGLTRERIRQREAKSLATLARRLRKVREAWFPELPAPEQQKDPEDVDETNGIHNPAEKLNPEKRRVVAARMGLISAETTPNAVRERS